ncbi:MAG: malate dehydrogenase [Actinomycetota bacterium]
MSDFFPPNSGSARVSIVGAGKVGSTLAQRIIEKNLADVVLLDVVEGWPQGIALDLMEARGLGGHDRTIIGTTHYEDTAGSDLVVIVAGLPRQPGMSRNDLLRANARIVADATKQAIAQSPNAVLMVVTNPLDVMTYVAWETSGLPYQRVLGMAGTLDSARFQSFIAMELGVPLKAIQAVVVGSHGDAMLPLPRHTTVNGQPLVEVMDAATIERLVQRTRHAGAEIVELMKAGSAYFAPSAATYAMVEAILLNQSRVLSCCAYLKGQYGLRDMFLGTPVRLGRGGVEEVLELELTEAEEMALIESAALVRGSVERARAMLSNW